MKNQPLEPHIEPGEIYLEALEGPPFTEADLVRGDVLAVFWASWSPRCRGIGARLRVLEKRWGERVQIVAINFQEDAATIRRFLGGDVAVVPVYLDLSGTFSRDQGVETLPSLVLFRDGENRYQGRLTDDVDRVILEILEAE